MDLGLKGKAVVVTGGAKGIGAGIVAAFVKEGASVVIADSDLDAAQQLAQKMQGDNSRALAIKADVTKKSDADGLTAATLDKFGNIDILVNNAGIVSDINFVDLEEAEWDRVCDVNIKGVYLVTRAVVPHMIAAREGKIVNISSMAGKRGNLGLTHYCASKFAVIGITQSLAKELGVHNINVNAVCPGIVGTAMWDLLLDARSHRQSISREQIWETWMEQIPLRRPQTSEDMANAVLFLSSEISKNITGEAISVNGGLFMD